MEQEEIFKFAMIGLGAYLLWTYVIEPMMNPTQTVAAQPPPQQSGVSIPPTQTGTQAAAAAPSTPAVTAAQLQSLAKTLLLTPDQWAYYYNGLPGKTISPQQMETILANLHLTDATRATNVTSAQFVSALQSAGLSGIVPSWVSSGGPAFNAFQPAGGLSGMGGFSSHYRGFRSAPKAGGWIQ